MKRPTIEELLAQNPDVDPNELKEAQQLADRLKDSGFEGARYRLATPLTGRRARDRSPDQIRERHSHSLVRRH